MDPNALAPWRDLSIVWFVLWTMVFVLIPGAFFFFALKYLRIFNRWLRLPLLNAQVWALRIQQGTARVSENIAEVRFLPTKQPARCAETSVPSRYALKP